MTQREYQIIKAAGDCTTALIMNRANRENRDLTEQELATCKRIYNKMTLAAFERKKSEAAERSKEMHFNNSVHGRRARAFIRTRR